MFFFTVGKKNEAFRHKVRNASNKQANACC